MAKNLVVAAVLFLSLAGTAGIAAAAPSFDQNPLLHVSWETFTIAGEHILTTVVIHAGGATEITETREDQPARIVRGVASAKSLAALNAAMQAGQIGFERGGCGGPTADGPIEYEITWYGKGTRFNTFRVGASLLSCPAGLQGIVNSITLLADSVALDTKSQKFPRVQN
ncbi:MAG TPA: hypothetical protein VN493_21570 [Thermoanaerobaculia bacterium]|nr:hypothetical protein [Thermoanaerobaculia bacterium]